MDDLISRQAAVDRIDAIFPVDPMKTEYAQGIACGAALAKTYIKQLPSAQPDRKKGKWIDGQCSICGCDIPAYIIDWKWQKDMDANYCPSCGARMDGESK